MDNSLEFLFYVYFWYHYIFLILGLVLLGSGYHKWGTIFICFGGISAFADHMIHTESVLESGEIDGLYLGITWWLYTIFAGIIFLIVIAFATLDSLIKYIHKNQK